MARRTRCVRAHHVFVVVLEALVPQNAVVDVVALGGAASARSFPTRSAPDPQAVQEVARVLVVAQRPVFYAGQGIHYAQAWDRLRALAELLEAPVVTSLQAKSAFPETHPLSAGSGGRSIPKTVFHVLQNADVIFGIGCSFTTSNFATPMPKRKRSSTPPWIRRT